jgi:hypothetical protein
MAKKIKPRPRWGIETNYLASYLASIDEQKIRDKVLTIPHKLGLNLSAELKKEYDDAIKEYLIRKRLFNDPPRRNEVKAALNDLVENSKLFRDSFENLDSISMSFIEEQGIDLQSEPIKEVICNVDLIESAATKALILCNTLKSTSGRPPEEPRTFLIKKLYDIHLKATEKVGLTYNSINDSYSGTLFDLVLKCLNTLNEPIQSEASLGKAIQRAYKPINTPHKS